MARLIEFIPNISEGRDKDKINTLINACKEVEKTFKVRLVDYSSDADHNRSVFTFIGDEEGIEEVSLTLVKEAMKVIDLTKHLGKHPRIGAIDVMPYVPLEDATIEDCINISKKVGKRIGELGIPVYLYEYSQEREYLKNLANVRKGEFEKLDEKLKDEKYYPDYGPHQKHPTFGAVAIGARNYLIAYNVILDTNDIQVAKKIAKKIRESSGGIKYIKALGIKLEERNLVQVSMNLVRYDITPIFIAFDFIKKEVKKYGVKISESELIGLLPNDAVSDVCKHYLSLNCDLNNRIIENKIRKLDFMNMEKNEQNKLNKDIFEDTVHDFLDELKSSKPTPGGGSVSSICAALGEGLLQMVTNLTIGKEKYQEYNDLINETITITNISLNKYKELAQQDIDLYSEVSNAYKLPNKTLEEKENRSNEIMKALMKAKQPPMELLKMIKASCLLLDKIYDKFNKNLISDFGVASKLYEAASDSAYLNIIINEKALSQMKNKNLINYDTSDDARLLRDEIRVLTSKIYDNVITLIIK